MTTNPFTTLTHLAGAHALALTGTVGIGALLVAVARLRVRRRSADTRHAVWVQVHPPPGGLEFPVVLWRLLATVLPRPRWWAAPVTLTWLVHATPEHLRCGVLVPAGVNPTAVQRALQATWPGVRTSNAGPPAAPGAPWALAHATVRLANQPRVALVEHPHRCG